MEKRPIQNAEITYVVEWYDMDGRFHTDIIPSHKSGYRSYDVSYVHKWNDPDKGLREFLSHLPLHNVVISSYLD